MIVAPGDLIADCNGRCGVVVCCYRAYHDYSDEFDWRWLIVFPDELIDTDTMADCGLVVRVPRGIIP